MSLETEKELETEVTIEKKISGIKRSDIYFVSSSTDRNVYENAKTKQTQT